MAHINARMGKSAPYFGSTRKLDGYTEPHTKKVKLDGDWVTVTCDHSASQPEWVKRATEHRLPVRVSER